MNEQGNFMIHLSVLYRNTQKYFDRVMEKYQIGWGQLMFLFFINENEGITMQDVTKIGEVDKGTTSKSIRTLQDRGYVTVRQDLEDKRVRRLYTTEKASRIMTSLYEYRNRFKNDVFTGVDSEAFEEMLAKICDNSKELETSECEETLRIGRMKEMSLRALEGFVSCEVYASGCGFKCALCPHRDLVFVPEDSTFVEENTVMTFLRRRICFLDAVCITGGEPLMQNAVLSFMKECKELGLIVKLETNGTVPERLRKVLQEGLADLVSMAIKNTREKYAETVGLDRDAFNYSGIEESIRLLRENAIPYQFTTVISKKTHTMDDLIEIAKQVGNDVWRISCFDKSEYDKEELDKMMKTLRRYARHTDWGR